MRDALATKARGCRVEACPRLAVRYERECFEHLDATIAAAPAPIDPRLAAVAGITTGVSERDLRQRWSDADFYGALGRMMVPGLALALAEYERGPRVRVCRAQCSRTQVEGSEFCRIHGGAAL